MKYCKQKSLKRRQYVDRVELSWQGINSPSRWATGLLVCSGIAIVQPLLPPVCKTRPADLGDGLGRVRSSLLWGREWQRSEQKWRAGGAALLLEGRGGNPVPLSENALGAWKTSAELLARDTGLQWLGGVRARNRALAVAGVLARIFLSQIRLRSFVFLQAARLCSGWTLVNETVRRGPRLQLSSAKWYWMPFPLLLPSCGSAWPRGPQGRQTR